MGEEAFESLGCSPCEVSMKDTGQNHKISSEIDGQHVELVLEPHPKQKQINKDLSTATSSTSDVSETDLPSFCGRKSSDTSDPQDPENSWYFNSNVIELNNCNADYQMHAQKERQYLFDLNRCNAGDQIHAQHERSYVFDLNQCNVDDQVNAQSDRPYVFDPLTSYEESETEEHMDSYTLPTVSRRNELEADSSASPDSSLESFGSTNSASTDDSFLNNPELKDLFQYIDKLLVLSASSEDDDGLNDELNAMHEMQTELKKELEQAVLVTESTSGIVPPPVDSIRQLQSQNEKKSDKSWDVDPCCGVFQGLPVSFQTSFPRNPGFKSPCNGNDYFGSDYPEACAGIEISEDAFRLLKLGEKKPDSSTIAPTSGMEIVSALRGFLHDYLTSTSTLTVGLPFRALLWNVVLENHSSFGDCVREGSHWKTALYRASKAILHSHQASFPPLLSATDSPVSFSEVFSKDTNMSSDLVVPADEEDARSQGQIANEKPGKRAEVTRKIVGGLVATLKCQCDNVNTVAFDAEQSIEMILLPTIREEQSSNSDRVQILEPDVNTVESNNSGFDHHIRKALNNWHYKNFRAHEFVAVPCVASEREYESGDEGVSGFEDQMVEELTVAESPYTDKDYLRNLPSYVKSLLDSSVEGSDLDVDPVDNAQNTEQESYNKPSNLHLSHNKGLLQETDEIEAEVPQDFAAQPSAPRSPKVGPSFVSCHALTHVLLVGCGSDYETSNGGTGGSVNHSSKMAKSSSEDGDKTRNTEQLDYYAHQSVSGVEWPGGISSFSVVQNTELDPKILESVNGLEWPGGMPSFSLELCKSECRLLKLHKPIPVTLLMRRVNNDTATVVRGTLHKFLAGTSTFAGGLPFNTFIWNVALSDCVIASESSQSNQVQPNRTNWLLTMKNMVKFILHVRRVYSLPPLVADGLTTNFSQVFENYDKRRSATNSTIAAKSESTLNPPLQHRLQELEQKELDLLKQLQAIRMEKLSFRCPEIRTNTIGIVGFGRLGQRLARTFQKYGRVVATSRSNYTEIANDMGINFVQLENPASFFQNGIDVIVLAVSITSFESTVSRLVPYIENDIENRIRYGVTPGPLVVDVLSVKEHTREVMLRLLPQECDIMCSHPMFGPDAGNDWQGMNFVYEGTRLIKSKESIENYGKLTRLDRFERFLSIWKEEGCRMILMSCQEHDVHAANSTFTARFLSRVLQLQGLSRTPFSTNEFDTVLNLIESPSTESFDHFYGLYRYNRHSIERVRALQNSIIFLMERIGKMEAEIHKM